MHKMRRVKRSRLRDKRERNSSQRKNIPLIAAIVSLVASILIWQEDMQLGLMFFAIFAVAMGAFAFGWWIGGKTESEKKKGDQQEESSEDPKG